MRFAKWLLTISLMGILSYFLYEEWGYFDLLLEHDLSYLSWVILSLLALCSLKIGQTALFGHRLNVDEYVLPNDLFFYLGFIGTLIGFWVVIDGVFGNVTGVGPEATVILMGNLPVLVSGIGTSILTTLTGLGAIVLMRLQIYMVGEDG